MSPRAQAPLTTTLAPAAPTGAALVSAGTLLVSGKGKVAWSDAAAARLLGVPSCTGARLDALLEPPPDAPVTDGPVGVTARTGRALLAHRATVPGAGEVWTLIQLDAYLAERQALAAAQLRSTISSVIGGFAHEVRNPMAAILSLTEAGLQDPVARGFEPLHRIPGLVQRVEALIQQALAYSRPKRPDRSHVPAGALLQGALGLLRRRERSIPVVTTGADDPLEVLVDVAQAERSLINLLENALDVAQRGVSVRVRAADVANVVWIDVSDDGPGVPEEHRERIFEPFFTTKASGTGLGLAIARDLARLNGGDLMLRPPAEGGGATFRLVLANRVGAVWPER